MNTYEGTAGALGLRPEIKEAVKVRYCLYARKLTEQDEVQALSIDSQIKEMVALATRDGLDVVTTKRESHVDFGWHIFTDAVIRAVSERSEHVVFMLWGSFAGKKEELIDLTKHLVLKSPHPSPLSASRGFMGNGHFKTANEYLEEHARGEINWK